VDLLYRVFGDRLLPLQLAIAALAVLALSLILTPLVRELALRIGDLAPIGPRDVHTRPIPRLGGLAIYLAFVTGVVLFEPLAGARLDVLSNLSIDAGGTITQIHGLLIGGTIALLVGVVDELIRQQGRRGLSPAAHFAGQVLAAGVALASGLKPVRGIANPLSIHLFYAHPEQHKQILLLGPVGVLFTMFWIVGMMNTINFLDGLDGLAGGVVMIAAILLAVWSGRVHDAGFGPLLGSEVLMLPPLILAAALLGFLCFNWWPARIFMGDSGAQFAGFTVGVLAVLGPAKIGTALLILAVPILDIAWVFVRRPASGRKFFHDDREHLHHRLLDLGWSQQRIVLSFYTICIALSVADLLLSSVAKLIAFLVVAITTVAVLARITLKAPRRIAAAGPPTPQPQS
jgi:UDP-N-acetylmuramyl pentapeptide phosphotransferase/UDP-N-acetylglucosamine-1-phosphate transferase